MFCPVIEASKPLTGVREFNSDNEEVYQIVINQLLRTYKKEDIINVDCWSLAAWNTELSVYLCTLRG
jgi:hypothetical protein